MNITEDMEELEAMESDIALEKAIIELARNGYTYKGIQLRLGNPSKKKIRQVIQKYDKELASILGNTKALNEYRDKDI